MSDTHRPHILIVSDDLDLSQFLNEGLVIAGFWTSVVASSLQTLELFRLRTFDAMVIDVALEGLGAEELVRRLTVAREGPARADIPILAIAGNPDEITLAMASLLPADAFVLPPIDIETLAIRLFQTVRQWRIDHPNRPWADDLAQRRE